MLQHMAQACTGRLRESGWAVPFGTEAGAMAFLEVEHLVLAKLAQQDYIQPMVLEAVCDVFG